jgi:hypothetical protein
VRIIFKHTTEATIFADFAGEASSPYASGKSTPNKLPDECFDNRRDHLVFLDPLKQLKNPS